jgi:hypothetical protein
MRHGRGFIYKTIINRIPIPAAPPNAQISGASQSSFSAYSLVNGRGGLCGNTVETLQNNSSISGRSATAATTKINSINYAAGYVKTAGAGSFQSSFNGNGLAVGRGSLSARTISDAQTFSSINGRLSANGARFTDSLNSSALLNGRGILSGAFAAAQIDFASAGARIALSARSLSSFELYSAIRQAIVTSPLFGSFYSTHQVRSLISGRGILSAGSISGLSSFSIIKGKGALSGNEVNGFILRSAINGRIIGSGRFTASSDFISSLQIKYGLAGMYIVSFPSFADAYNASAPQQGALRGRFLMSMRSHLFLADTRRVLRGESRINFLVVGNEAFLIELNGESRINSEIQEVSQIKSFTNV